MVVGCGLWVSAVILPEPFRSQPGLQQAQRPGASLPHLEFVGSCGATAPPAGRLLQGPELFTGEASLPLPGGPGLPIHPPGLAPEICLGLPGSAERGGF